MSVRAVALAATPGVIGRHELCMGGKQVVESAQHEGAAFELELAHVCHCCTSGVWAAVGQRCGILARIVALSFFLPEQSAAPELALGTAPAIIRLVPGLRETWRRIAELVHLELTERH